MPELNNFPLLSMSILFVVYISFNLSITGQNKENLPEFIVQTGHISDVRSVAFSPDNKMLASGALDNTVKLWDLQTGRELRTFAANKDVTSAVFSVKFSPDGKILASAGSTDNAINLWNIKTGEKIKSLQEHSDRVMSIAFSPDGQTLVSGSWDDTVKIWDLKTGKVLKTLTGHKSDVYSVSFSSDGTMIASSTYENSEIIIWNAKTGEKINSLAGHNRGVSSVAFSPKDNNILASGGNDRTVKIWNVITGELIRPPITGHELAVKCVAFSPNGKILASAESFTTTKLWNIDSGDEIGNFTSEKSSVESVDFSSDGQMIALGSGEDIRIFNLQDKREIKRLSGTSSYIWSAAFSPDSKLLATGNNDQTVKLWDLNTGKLRITLPTFAKQIWSLTFSSNGEYLAFVTGYAANNPPTVCVWNIKTAKEIKRLPEHIKFAFSPDGRYLATVYGIQKKSVKLWNLENEEEPKTFEGSDSDIFSIEFSPDGKKLAAGGYNRVLFWNTENGKKEQPIEGHTSTIWKVAFSSNGRFLATGSDDKSARIWDLVEKKEIAAFGGLQSSVWQVEFSSDSNILAGRSGNETFKLWDLTKSKEIFSSNSDDLSTARQIYSIVPNLFLKSNSEPVSPDGKLQIKIGNDGRINIYDLSRENLLLSLIALDKTNWVNITAKGLFDTNNLENPKGLHWIFPDAPLSPLSFEIFMRDYYQPRLLSRVMKGETFPDLSSVAELNRNQPKIVNINVLPKTDDPFLVDVNVEVSSTSGKCFRRDKYIPCKSGIYDLHLYRDGQLVGQSPDYRTRVSTLGFNKKTRRQLLLQWREEAAVKTNNAGAIPLSTEKRIITFKNIRIPKRAKITRVEFTAYAFNEDRVKSATSEPVIYTLPHLRPKNKESRAYVVTVGVDATSSSNWRLLFAPHGARDIEQVLKEKLQSDYEVVPVQLISEFEEDGIGLKQNLATKNNIKTVLEILSGRNVPIERRVHLPDQNNLQTATPDDLVFIYIASHGYAAPNGIFYIVPADIGKTSLEVSEAVLNRCSTTNEKSAVCDSAAAFLEQTISSEELGQWLYEIDAGDMTLILDSCHSGAITGPNFKPGPMGDRNFGQLSYDKGLRILAATQAENFAWGTLALNDRSLLTYVLTRHNNSQPFDIESWLAGAEKNVPELYEKQLAGEKQQTQEPIFLNFRKYPTE